MPDTAAQTIRSGAADSALDGDRIRSPVARLAPGLLGSGMAMTPQLLVLCAVSGSSGAGSVGVGDAKPEDGPENPGDRGGDQRQTEVGGEQADVGDW